MKPTHGKILVRCDLKQKDQMTIAGVTVKCANIYNTNYRERSPVVCVVEKGNKIVKEGDILLAHHNTFYTPSPFQLEGNLFSIPFGRTLFARVSNDGSLQPICGNMLCDRVDIETAIPVPAEHRKQYVDRVIVTDPEESPYKEGQLLFTQTHAFYQIVYIWNGIETKVHKCHQDMVLGYAKPIKS